MKTIKEISVERSIDRSTLLKAAQRNAFGESARKSGDTWLIDDESLSFQAWLASYLHRSKTIQAETPDAPEWVTSKAALYAWKNDHNWRGDAASADTTQYRHFLLREAQRLYGEKV